MPVFVVSWGNYDYRSHAAALFDFMPIWSPLMPWQGVTLSQPQPPGMLFGIDPAVHETPPDELWWNGCGCLQFQIVGALALPITTVSGGPRCSSEEHVFEWTEDTGRDDFYQMMDEAMCPGSTVGCPEADYIREVLRPIFVHYGPLDCTIFQRKADTQHSPAFVFVHHGSNRSRQLTSHELGHVLWSPSHDGDSACLMSENALGTALRTEQCQIACDRAADYSESFRQCDLSRGRTTPQGTPAWPGDELPVPGDSVTLTEVCCNLGGSFRLLDVGLCVGTGGSAVNKTKCKPCCAVQQSPPHATNVCPWECALEDLLDEDQCHQVCCDDRLPRVGRRDLRLLAGGSAVTPRSTLTAAAALAAWLQGCGATTDDGAGGASGSGGYGGSGGCISANWRPLGVGVSGDNRYEHSAVRAADAIYVWGGRRMTDGKQTWVGTGWKVNPETGEVTPLPTEGAPSARTRHFAGASPDGRHVLIYGGDGLTGSTFDGGRYDTQTASWVPLAGGAPGPRIASGSAGNLGLGWLLWGVNPDSELTGGLYEFQSDGWVPVAPAGTPAPPTHGAAVQLPGRVEVLLWGGSAAPIGEGYHAHGAIYSLAHGPGEWIPVPAQPELTARGLHSLVASVETDEVIVWGGSFKGEPLSDGARRAASGGNWILLETEGAPSPRRFHHAVVLGHKMVILGGSSGAGASMDLADGAIYDLVQHRWEPLPAECAPPPVAGTFIKWSETTAVLWGSPIVGLGEEPLPEQGWVFTLTE